MGQLFLEAEAQNQWQRYRGRDADPAPSRRNAGGTAHE